MTVSRLSRTTALLALASFSLTPLTRADSSAVFSVTEVEPAHREAFLAVAMKDAGKTRADDSSSRLDLFVDTANPNRFLRFQLLPGQGARTADLRSLPAPAPAIGSTRTLPLSPYNPASTQGLARTDPLAGETSAVIVVFEANEPLAQEFLSEFDKLAAETRRSPDNLAFELYQVTGRPGTHVLFERWRTPAAYATHLSRPYVRDFYKHLPALVSTRTRYITANIP